MKTSKNISSPNKQTMKGGISNNEFIDAAKNGDLNRVKEAIKEGVNINARNNYGYTALMYAVYQGRSHIFKITNTNNDYLDIIKLLIENGADVNAKRNDDGETVLIHSLMYGSINTDYIVKLLVENGADVNAKNYLGKTVLMYAFEHGYDFTYIIKTLIENGADVNAKDNYNVSVLMYAFEYFDFNVRINKNFNNKNVQSKNINDAIVFIVKLLIEKGVDINSVLILASQKDYINIVDFVIKNGANVNTINKNGDTALMIASLYGHIDIAKLLIENGADVKVKNKDGETARDIALQEGNLEIVKLIDKIITTKLLVFKHPEKWGPIEVKLEVEDEDKVVAHFKNNEELYNSIANQLFDVIRDYYQRHPDEL